MKMDEVDPKGLQLFIWWKIISNWVISLGYLNIDKTHEIGKNDFFCLIYHCKDTISHSPNLVPNLRNPFRIFAITFELLYQIGRSDRPNLVSNSWTRLGFSSLKRTLMLRKTNSVRIEYENVVCHIENAGNCTRLSISIDLVSYLKIRRFQNSAL